jgi:hypothetical protein
MSKVTSRTPASSPAAPPAADNHQPAGRKAPPFDLLSAESLRLSGVEAVELARRHQALPRSPTEREMEPRRVKELLDRIRSGLLLPCSWATVDYRGTKFRMNGQHSSEAILQAGDLLPDRVAVHLDHYRTDSAEGMGALFRQFDARFSGRTKQDVAGAYQGLVEPLQKLGRRKAKLGIEGVAWYLRTIEGVAFPSGDELYQQFMTEAYHAFLRWLDRILSPKTPEMERAPVVGAMYATFITSESRSQEFWPHVAREDLADDSDPRSVLSAELVAVKENKGKVPPPTPGEFYAKCIKAWNAFANGDKIRSLNVNPKKGMPDIAA